MGGAGNDTLQGGEGDDTLIGGLGDDLLEGGLGTNYYLPGIDQNNSFCEHDRIVGTRDGFDIIFFKDNIDQYLRSNNCNNSSCRISKIQENNRKLVDIIKGDLLVFNDQREELFPGEAENLEPPEPGPCNLAVEIQAPPEQAEDPRWEVLRATSEILKGILRSGIGIYDRNNREETSVLLVNRLQETINSLPEDISNQICILTHPDRWVKRWGVVSFTYRPRINDTCEWGGEGFGGYGYIGFWAHGDMRVPSWDGARITKVGNRNYHCSNLRVMDFRTGSQRDSC